MDESPRMVSLEREEESLVATWSDGRRDVLPHIWLRDNSPDAFHANGQRVLDTFTLPDNPRPREARLTDGGELEVRWSEAEVVIYASEFLRAYAHAHPHPHPHPRKGEADGMARPGIRLWKGADWAEGPPRGKFNAVMEQGDALRRWLRAANDYGFAILDGVPLKDDSIKEVVSLFGYARETNYGDYWDVRSIAQPNNLAFTGMALGVHTDNPYRDPVPTVQILMCMESDVSGGESILVDGFAAAHELRETRPEYFRLLTETPVRFRFRDEGVDLEDEKNIIALDSRGRIRAVHFNNRSLAPLQCPPDEMRDMYAAYRAFAELLYTPDFEVRFRLEPGQLFLVDNRRVLHGRTALSGGGGRRLRGCYADMDGLRSKLAVLDRRHESELGHVLERGNKLAGAPG